MLILQSATVHKISTLADKTLKVELFLRELPHDQMALLLSAYMEGREGVEIDEVKTDCDRTPSQRLRAVIAVWHKQAGSEKNFESFYIEKMEWLINYIKQKLN